MNESFGKEFDFSKGRQHQNPAEFRQDFRFTSIEIAVSDALPTSNRVGHRAKHAASKLDLSAKTKHEGLGIMSTQIEEGTSEATLSLEPLCRSAELERGWGEALWLETTQLALFRTEEDAFFATSHHCPTSGAKVMARGILGDTVVDGDSVATVACPLHKEVYRLDTGECLNADSLPLPVQRLMEIEGQLWMEQIK
ncbi:nitrite reductase (NAD(P)H) small subunit [Glutamicibacter sp. HZAU]|uniref:nitrite reductase (NAD(P)H) small subunit n=2 Tax=unclassified Glutamicibacter TaxID=2627139 RepID=UPI001F3BA134|nr:nitrite reductase (NAD(P)H) small subunit [Glutamicibacter sp. HZAU]